MMVFILQDAQTTEKDIEGKQESNQSLTNPIHTVFDSFDPNLSSRFLICKSSFGIFEVSEISTPFQCHVVLPGMFLNILFATNKHLSRITRELLSLLKVFALHFIALIAKWDIFFFSCFLLLFIYVFSVY
jgi:hypothetical protein